MQVSLQDDTVVEGSADEERIALAERRRPFIVLGMFACFVPLIFVPIATLVTVLLAIGQDMLLARFSPIPNHSEFPSCREDFQSLFWRSLGYFDDPPCVEPVCGFLINSTLIPPKLSELGSDKRFVGFMPGHNLNISDVKDLPHACQQIHITDMVIKSTGKDCSRFCNHRLGDSISFLQSGECSQISGAGVIHLICAKAFAYDYFGKLPWWSPIAACVLVLVAGQMVAQIKSFWKGALEGLRSSSTPVSVTSETLADEPPDHNSCLAKGPYLNSSTGRAYYSFPWCCFECESDFEGSRLQMRTQSTAVLADPFTDIANNVSYLQAGQPFYACLTMFGILATGDPLQYKAMEAFKESCKRGWDTRDYLEHKFFEGMWEATINASIAIFSFITTSPANFTPFVFCLRIMSIGISLFSTSLCGGSPPRCQHQ